MQSRKVSRRDHRVTVLFVMRLFQSGLDIVRKSPGRHKIAIVQTTIIDGEARLIRLTMVLAHSSGKCVSSDWQVCPFAETASPHRMGAALTNARLCAFQLVWNRR